MHGSQFGRRSSTELVQKQNAEKDVSRTEWDHPDIYLFSITFLQTLDLTSSPSVR